MPKIFFKDFEEKIAELSLHVITPLFNMFSQDFVCKTDRDSGIPQWEKGRGCAVGA